MAEPLTADDIRELARLNHSGVHSCAGICLAVVVATLDAARAAAPVGETDDAGRTPDWYEGYQAAMRDAKKIVPPAPDPVAGLREAAGRVLAWLGTCDQFDHHGNCQTHAIEKPCRVAALRAALLDANRQEGVKP